MQPEMIQLKGNGYEIRDQLKAMGGEYDIASKTWKVTADQFVEAERLLKSLFSRVPPPNGNRTRALTLRGFDALMRPNFVFLQDDVKFFKTWNSEAELRIRDCAKCLGAAGQDVAWVERTLECFVRNCYEERIEGRLYKHGCAGCGHGVPAFGSRKCQL